MKLDTIGKNIRKFRLAKKLRQEDLAEKTDLTTNYIASAAMLFFIRFLCFSYIFWKCF